MNYQQTLDFLYNQLPMFQRIGAAAYKNDLSVSIKFSEILNFPELSFPAIHIAGTNGKGSVSHLIASVLQESGYKTGLFTSPHLKDFRERIRVNGKMIAKRDVTDFVGSNRAHLSDIDPSFFEYSYAMAMDYFRHRHVDVAVVETGMGGRLDSTNLVQPVLTVITNISYDHMQFLGDTLEKIAYEKAGIIKPGIPVVVGETQQDVKQVFVKKAEVSDAEIAFADQLWDISEIKERGVSITSRCFAISSLLNEQHYKISCPLFGNYQKKNLLTALESLNQLKGLGFNIPESSISEGFRKVIRNTGIIGRWQILQRKPLTICDTAHNTEGVKMVIGQLEEFEFDRLHFVLGLANDKDINNILAILPRQAIYYYCKADIPRGLDKSILTATAKKHGLTGTGYDSVKDALDHAIANAGEDDLVFIGGSIFVVAEIL